VEGFTTPQSNIRTEGLPNPCPVGLQSCCSILLGSPPPGCAHTCRDTCPSAVLATAGRNARPLVVLLDQRPPGFPPPICTGPQPGAGPTACWDTPPPKPTALQALLSSSYMPDDQNPPHPSGPAWLQLCVEQLEPCPAGTGIMLVWDSCIHQPARNPVPCAELAPALQASHITSPPGSCSLAPRGLQACLRDTHRLDWTLKN
jgi:hypothetical protein